MDARRGAALQIAGSQASPLPAEAVYLTVPPAYRAPPSWTYSTSPVVKRPRPATASATKKSPPRGLASPWNPAAGDGGRQPRWTEEAVLLIPDDANRGKEEPTRPEGVGRGRGPAEGSRKEAAERSCDSEGGKKKGRRGGRGYAGGRGAGRGSRGPAAARAGLCQRRKQVGGAGCGWGAFCLSWASGWQAGCLCGPRSCDRGPAEPLGPQPCLRGGLPKPRLAQPQGVSVDL
ncbi:LOW QUALITY PROTEIN: translation initiation factor IF-2 [Myotis myotis]|uniref:LOW QUALITY PROTEIN: translation initiation factor IF-2 n=1 Tax=Myotis myotis TaxID=51298 RepID=UPI00174A84CF|nr:LOW QUALITY PROTEIN: translation initiation factor IF-2 [Myotis myotis]